MGLRAALSLECLVWGVSLTLGLWLCDRCVCFSTGLFFIVGLSFGRRQLRGGCYGRTFWLGWERMVSGTGWLYGSDVVYRRGCLFVE